MLCYLRNILFLSFFIPLFVYSEFNSPCCCSDSGCKAFFIRADFLYFRPFEDGLICPCGPFDIVDTVDANDQLNSTIVTENHDPHFKWHPGFRIGAGIKLRDDVLWGWDWQGFYTHFFSHTKGEHHFNWKLTFDEIDLQLGYQFGFCNGITIRPFAGVRIARIHQKVNTRFISTVVPINNILETTTKEQNDKEHFLGVGPLFGLDAKMPLFCSIGLFAKGSMGFLYSHFHTRFNEFEATVVEGEINDTSTSTNKQDQKACELTADFTFGVQWKRSICDKFLLTFSCAYEHHRYFNFNRINNYGDFCLDGIRVSANLRF